MLLNFHAIAQFIEDITTPLIVATRSRWRSPSRSLITFDVPHLTPNEQRTLWQLHLGETAAQFNGHIDALVAQFQLSEPTIKTVCTTANRQYVPNSTPDNEQQSPHIGTLLWDTCRIQVRQSLDGLAQRILKFDRAGFSPQSKGSEP